MMDNIFSHQSWNLQAITEGTIETKPARGTTDQVYIEDVLDNDLGDKEDVRSSSCQFYSSQLKQ